MGYQRRVHGEFSELSVIMQFLIAASLLVAGSTAQLVTYPNGAVAPFDPNVAIATANHYAAKIAHGSYFPYAGALGVHPAAAVYGRKKREAQLPVNLVTGYSHVGYPYYGYGVAPVVAPFVAHPNGALVPAEPKEVVDARAERNRPRTRRVRPRDVHGSEAGHDES